MAEQRNWQPIATAPKDGTTILSWNGEERVIVRWWSDDLKPSDGNWDVVHDVEDYAYTDYAPTHWMPLPEPPALTEGEKE